jgi:hypothetical protein
MKQGLKEGLHGFDAVRGSPLAKERTKTYHGAKERHSPLNDGDMIGVSPETHVVRHLRVSGPKN